MSKHIFRSAKYLQCDKTIQILRSYYQSVVLPQSAFEQHVLLITNEKVMQECPLDYVKLDRSI